MIEGYMNLGGGQELVLMADTQYEGQPAGPHRGRWKMNTRLLTTTLSIPSRDKQVQLFYSQGISEFAPAMARIDSEEPGSNYRTKLRSILGSLGPEFCGAVNNIGTHRSLAFLTCEPKLHLYGLFDTVLKSSYLVWHSNPDQIHELIAHYPLRFLLYRFPCLQNDALFLPIESTCSRWWRWSKKTEHGPLQPFNALEHRLFGSVLPATD